MSEYTEVATVSDLGPGTLRLVTLHGEDVLVTNVDGTVYAVGARCTHDEGPLEEGELEDGCIRCPWHFSLFDLATGEVIESPAPEPIATYHVRVEGDSILIAPASA